ncbi:carbohydrate ABC transporter permease [Paenibacillus sp. 1P07SE]|uniref:carbohydrate ABC transporter permease n=1 Tax=Paenibacillus sp. 1P07SE TaxID=3132209 RepID=UPI0039A45513
MVSRKWTFFDTVNYVLLFCVMLIAIVPLLYVLSVSLTPYGEVLRNGGFVLFPQSFTLEAYRFLYEESTIGRSFGVTAFITVVGTAINMILSVLLAYPLSRKALRFRSAFLLFVIFTMIFNGGLIPTYLVVKNVGLLDSVWAMMIPNAIATFNVIILKSFFENLPNEILESARIDGASEWRTLLQVVVPLSVPALLTVGLFYLVSHWNEFFHAILYVQDKRLHPVQVAVRELLLTTQQNNTNTDIIVPTVTIQMAAVVAASLPIICIYPFLQKHFTKGMLLGAVKG